MREETEKNRNVNKWADGRTDIPTHFIPSFPANDLINQSCPKRRCGNTYFENKLYKRMMFFFGIDVFQAFTERQESVTVKAGHFVVLSCRANHTIYWRHGNSAINTDSTRHFLFANGNLLIKQVWYSSNE